jgi:non-ribosomal peptide synthetase component F
MTSATKLTKRCAVALLLLALSLPCTPMLAQASDAGSLGPQAPAPPHHSRKSNIDTRVSILTKSLDLDEAQQSAVKNILEQRQQQTLRIRRDPSISGSARIDRFRALQDSTVERIRAVLNDEQKKKYDPLASRQIQSTPERSVEDWLKATTPK